MRASATPLAPRRATAAPLVQSTHSAVLRSGRISSLLSHQPLVPGAPSSATKPTILGKRGPEPARAAQTGASPPAVESASPERTVRVRYVRRDKKYDRWGLHTWGDVVQPTDWQRPLAPVGFDQQGIWWEVPLKPGARFLGLLVHVEETKSARAELQVSELGHASEVWLAGDEQTAFYGGAPDVSHLPVGNLGKQAAIWVSKDVIAWRTALHDIDGPRTFKLHVCKSAGMWINGEGVHGAQQEWTLEPVASTLPADLADKWPHLQGCSALRIPADALGQVYSLFQGQAALSCVSGKGVVLEATGLQLQGGLDAHCTYDGPLGVHTDPATGKLAVAVWAPTAQRVDLLHYKAAREGQPTPLPMARDALGPGVWSVVLPDGALWTYYKYRVTVYCPWSQRVEVCEATDPYSRSLAADGERTQVVPPDLTDPSMVPEGWSNHPSPPLERWTDISLYELHIRDFSSEDTSVKPELRGKYLAFVPELATASPGKLTHGLAHLAGLQEAGMNTLHLLPSYDFGSVPERPEEQAVVKDDLTRYAADSETQQGCVLHIADQDAFNWGYDPVHYGVPEGSYATDPDGVARIREYRQMVQALHAQGWRVVLDVVYNHVFASGPYSRYSVLDKIVPGYYQRRWEDGEMCHSTCCNNTATEHAMCERLVVDDIVHWARNYKVDGFRFDIMGHLMVSTLNKMRAGLDALTLEEHGVDGKRIYIYGEAWDFGEVLNNARGVNCGQMNLSGTRLGAFNDRLRDGALGGGPFAPWQWQGFVTGLSLAPNSCTTQGDAVAQAKELAVLSDWVRYSLAGNLRRFPMETANGRVLTGEEAKAHDLPLAYGGHPCEHVAFIGCHDNLTMFDFITEKAAANVPAAERTRMQVMCLSLILLSQGIPFVHAGDDLLRSKSLDRDSYNSGDWFNGVDWTGATHKLGIGLPVHTKNGGNWQHKRPLLTDASIKPTPAMLRSTAAITRQLLRLRYSSPLFRLPSTEAVLAQVRFHNTGPSQTLGVVVMELVSAAEDDPPPNSGPRAVDGTDVRAVRDPENERIVVVFNAAPTEQALPFPPMAGTLKLHPLQAASDGADERARACVADNSARLLRVQPRTTAVFVQPRAS